MKKSIMLGIVGIAATVATASYGQGFIQLANYITSSNIPSQISLGGSPISVSGYTVGLYFGAGSFVGSVAADPTGTAIPTALDASFSLGSGAGSSAALFDSTGGWPGSYAAGPSFQPGAGAGATITVMVVAYNGGNYAASTIRGHSLAFTMVTTIGTAFPSLTGVSETDGGFSLHAVPEPTTLALAGLGGLSLLLLRRKTA
jgi:hypothetical protein